MSLSQKNLSLIQKAGQAVHGASEAITATVSIQAQSMVASVSSRPFGEESDQSIARFKLLARLSQGLVDVEGKLQELYGIATELTNPATEVVIVKATKQRKATKARSVDVVSKPVKATKVAKAKKGGRKAVALTPNDSTLLKYLQGVLKAGEWTAQTGAVMAQGSGLPLGSVGVSLKKILVSGAVKAGERGMYQLATGITTPVGQGASVRKAKTSKADSGAAQNVKAKPAKKAKTALAKKVKATNSKKVNSADTTVAGAVAQADTALL